MERYVIVDFVDTKKNNLIQAKAPINTQDVIRAAMFAPLGVIPAAYMAINEKIKDKEIHEITSIEELAKYRNCIVDLNSDVDLWKKNVVYVAHPILKNNLIEESLYQGYIIREIISCLAEYITDKMAIAKLVIGLCNSKGVGAKGTVPIDKIVADAKVDGALDNNYKIVMEDISAGNRDNQDNLWINYFPDLRNAVDRQSGSLEITQSLDLAIDVNVGIKNIFNLGANLDNKRSIYIYYKKA